VKDDDGNEIELFEIDNVAELLGKNMTVRFGIQEA
jgi:hypothetical protein